MTVMERYMLIKIVPVAVVDNEAELRRLADLCMKYLPAIELTLRTPYALTALKVLKQDYPKLAVAAATVLSPAQADEAVSAGAELLISPGFTPLLLQHCKNKKYSYIPGVSTPSELEQCLLMGYHTIKMFPAEVIGGVKWLKAMESVYKHTGVRFMPLGGITAENVGSYLSMENVVNCGGSWLSPKPLMKAGSWDEIENRFEAASRILKGLK